MEVNGKLECLLDGKLDGNQKDKMRALQMVICGFEAGQLGGEFNSYADEDLLLSVVSENNGKIDGLFEDLLLS